MRRTQGTTTLLNEARGADDPAPASPEQERAIADLVKVRETNTSVMVYTFNTGQWTRDSVDVRADLQKLFSNTRSADVLVVGLQEVPTGEAGSMEEPIKRALDGRYTHCFTDSTSQSWRGWKANLAKFGLSTLVFSRNGFPGEVRSAGKRRRLKNTLTKQSLVSFLAINGPGVGRCDLRVVNTHAPFKGPLDTIVHFAKLHSVLIESNGVYANTILLGDFNSRFNKMTFNKNVSGTSASQQAAFDKYLCDSFALMNLYTKWYEEGAEGTFKEYLLQHGDAPCEEGAPRGMFGGPRRSSPYNRALDQLIEADEFGVLMKSAPTRVNQYIHHVKQIDNFPLVKTVLQALTHGAHLLSSMQEGAIDFPPTYKVEPNAGQPAVITGLKDDKKRRMPGYADRVAWITPGDVRVRCDLYNAFPINLHSDHLPVFALLKLRRERGDDRTVASSDTAPASVASDRVLEPFSVSVSGEKMGAAVLVAAVLSMLVFAMR